MVCTSNAQGTDRSPSVRELLDDHGWNIIGNAVVSICYPHVGETANLFESSWAIVGDWNNIIDMLWFLLGMPKERTVRGLLDNGGWNNVNYMPWFQWTFACIPGRYYWLE